MAIFETWITCRDVLLPAIAETHGTHSEDDVLIALLNNKAKLWTRVGSAIVTEMVQYPRMKVMHCWLGGGALAELMEMEKEIVAFAKQQGCARVTGGGRFGWERVLKDYTIAGTYMHKDL